MGFFEMSDDERQKLIDQMRDDMCDEIDRQILRELGMEYFQPNDIVMSRGTYPCLMRLLRRRPRRKGQVDIWWVEDLRSGQETVWSESMMRLRKLTDMEVLAWMAR